MESRPKFDRPREKLKERGPMALSDTELVAIIMGNGIRGRDVLQISAEVVRILREDSDFLDMERLTAIEGVGLARACQIMASMELARRFLVKTEILIQSPEDILPLIADIRAKQQEHFLCISLNGANELIKSRVVTVGLLNSSQVHPREVYADVITDRAASVVLVHNHPSGTLTPSESDIQITNQLVEAGRILGLSVLDHVIVSGKGYLSMKEHGYM
jgi:DNA repair protein RadC